MDILDKKEEDRGIIGNSCIFNFSGAFRVTIKSYVTNKVTDSQQSIIHAINENDKVTTSDLTGIVVISQRKIKENTSELKEYGILERIGSPKGGYWEVIR